MAILAPEWDDQPCANCGWTPETDTFGQRALWPSEGQAACDWIEASIMLGEGDMYGEMITLRPDQVEFVYEWYSFCGACNWWRFTGAIRGEGRGGGKTQFAAALAALELDGPESIAPTSPNICVAAASFEQADILFGQLGLAFGGSDEQLKEAPLYGEANVTVKKISFRTGKPGKAFRVAAKAATNEGGNPTLLLADETHEWGADGDPKARLFTVLRMGASKRKLRCKVVDKSTGEIKTIERGPGRWVMISTAGFDVNNNVLGTWYKRCKEAVHDPSIDPSTLFDWREAPDGLDYEDPAARDQACRAASGAADIIWDVANRVAEWGKVQKHEWIRYFANRWVEVAEDSWLVDFPAAWPACAAPTLCQRAEVDKDLQGVIAVDMALRHDSVGVVTIRYVDSGAGESLELKPPRYAPDEEGKFVVTPKKFMADDSGRIDHVAVWQYIKAEAHKLGDKLRGVVYDPRFFELPARMLEDDGYEMIQFDQNVARMAPACGKAFEMVKAGQFAHPDFYPLNDAVMTASRREQENGTFTLSKGKSRNKIDLCIAMVMGSWVLADLILTPVDQPFSIW